MVLEEFNEKVFISEAKLKSNLLYAKFSGEKKLLRTFDSLAVYIILKRLSGIFLKQAAYVCFIITENVGKV